MLTTSIIGPLEPPATCLISREDRAMVAGGTVRPQTGIPAACASTRSAFPHTTAHWHPHNALAPTRCHRHSGFILGLFTPVQAQLLAAQKGSGGTEFSWG